MVKLLVCQHIRQALGKIRLDQPGMRHPLPGNPKHLCGKINTGHRHAVIVQPPRQHAGAKADIQDPFSGFPPDPTVYGIQQLPIACKGVGALLLAGCHSLIIGIRPKIKTSLIQHMASPHKTVFSPPQIGSRALAIWKYTTKEMASTMVVIRGAAMMAGSA